MQSVEGMLTDLELSALLTAEIPRLLSMFGNIVTTSQDTSRDPSWNGPFAFKSSNLFIKLVESLTKDGRLCERGLRQNFVKAESCLIAVPQQNVISQRGLSCLCVLTFPKVTLGLDLQPTWQSPG